MIKNGVFCCCRFNVCCGIDIDNLKDVFMRKLLFVNLIGVVLFVGLVNSEMI